MEFPDLGCNCSFDSCNRLDFLPMKCDACGRLFCCDHIKYDLHACPSSYKKNVQVPICPLCNKPVPTGKNESPDIKVGEHIDRDCQSDPAKAKRSTEHHRCSARRCKNIEFVPVICSDCRRNYCLTHRNPLDHECSGFNRGALSDKTARSKTALAALSRQSQNHVASTSNRNASSSTQINGSLTEDEAVARALQLSLNDDCPVVDDSTRRKLEQEEIDRQLAQALARGEDSFSNEQQRQRDARRNNNCSIG